MNCNQNTANTKSTAKFKKTPRRLAWVFFVSKRFALSDRRGRTALTTFLSSLGIAFGVMTLIVTISVMNGFQMSYIDSIMEISSYHIRATVKESPFDQDSLLRRLASDSQYSNILSVTPFYEAQSLAVSPAGRQQGILIRAVPPDILSLDSGFNREVHINQGAFDLYSPSSIVLGQQLAQGLGVRPGDTVTLLAMSGGADTELFSTDRVFTVTGVFSCGYADINNSFAFINIQNGKNLFGQKAEPLYGIKMQKSQQDAAVLSHLVKDFPSLRFESWRSYNRAFFGALQVEKNMLMLLVFLIFVVVGINIFNSMRRMVFERREDISILTALGGKNSWVQGLFVLQGFLIGLLGSVPGLILGLLISVRMDTIFAFIASLTYNVQYFLVMLINPAASSVLQHNLMYAVYAKIPARIIFSEVLTITLFGIFSSLVAAWVASRGVLRLSIAEVLRDE